MPESPRWLIGKGRHRKAFEALLKFRSTPLQAAIDLYYTSKCIEVEEELARHRSRSRVVEMIKVPRIRRAVLASTIVMCVAVYLFSSSA